MARRLLLLLLLLLAACALATTEFYYDRVAALTAQTKVRRRVRAAAARCKRRDGDEMHRWLARGT